MDNLERRSSRTRVETDGGRRLRGTAIVYSVPSVDLGGFVEIISPDATARTLRSASEVHAFFNHDSGRVLGNTLAGTLILRSSRRGLEVEIDPPSGARDVVESVERGDIRGMSFGFRTKPEWVEWDFSQEIPLRTVHDMEFSEISIVAKPAYRQTDIDVALRSLQAFQAQHPQKNRDPRWLRLKLAR